MVYINFIIKQCASMLNSNLVNYKTQTDFTLGINKSFFNYFTCIICGDAFVITNFRFRSVYTFLRLFESVYTYTFIPLGIIEHFVLIHFNCKAVLKFHSTNIFQHWYIVLFKLVELIQLFTPVYSQWLLI